MVEDRPHYYPHHKKNKDADVQAFAEGMRRYTKDKIDNLTKELEFWDRVIELSSANVCQGCGGDTKVTWYPDGTGPGMGTRTLVPCPKCRPDEYRKETDEINRQYRRR